MPEMGYTYRQHTVAKVNTCKSLDLRRRNISKLPEEIKKRAYQVIVRPIVELLYSK